MNYREQAKELICELLAAAGGSLSGKTRLYKAFYAAHLFHLRETGRFLTGYPIVRMPNGPGIDQGDMLLRELADEGRIRIGSRPAGPFLEQVFDLAMSASVTVQDARFRSLRDAISWVSDRSAAELSAATHELSRSWNSTFDGDELDLVLDLASDEELEQSKRSATDVTVRLDAVFELQHA